MLIQEIMPEVVEATAGLTECLEFDALHSACLMG